jgi:tight adherence protein B
MNDILIRLAVLVTVFATIFIVSQGILQRMANRRAETQAVNRRMELLKAGITHEQAGEILRKGVADRLAPNAGLAERLYYRFQCMVRIADIGMEPRSIIAFCLLAFAGLTSLLLFMAWAAGFQITSGILQLVFTINTALTIALPLFIISRRKEKRRKKMEEQFPVALDVFTRALLAGHPVAAAIDLLTNEMEDPLGSEFGIVADEVAYGATLTDSLMAMADRWDQPDIRMFAVSISLQNETGGNLAEILRNLSQVIRDRASIYMKVRALSSEGRMSGWMLTVLPVFTIVSMFILNPSFYFTVASDPIFTRGFTGLLILYAIGVLTIRRMIDLKV